MRRPAALNLALIQEDDNDDHHLRNQQQYQWDNSITTFRQEGVTIGPDYLRLDGCTLTRGELVPSSLQLQQTLGRGSCSIVQCALWNPPSSHPSRSPKLVALKQFVLMLERRDKLLIRELRALCRVDCDCLVTCYGAFLEHSTATLVLEYMDRGSLVTFLKQQEQQQQHLFATEPPLAALAYQLLWGLSYLHHERMLHRDIKPANILLHSNGYIKLSDFGIVTTLGEPSLLHTTVVGTTRYMSPERLRAKPYGSASDIWSLGLVILECAKGESPWKDVSSMVELIVTIEDMPMYEIIPKDCSDGLRDILVACLQRVPEKRMPAHLLLESPWFETNGIRSVQDAVHIMREHFSSVDASRHIDNEK